MSCDTIDLTEREAAQREGFIRFLARDGYPTYKALVNWGNGEKWKSYPNPHLLVEIPTRAERLSMEKRERELNVANWGIQFFRDPRYA